MLVQSARLMAPVAKTATNGQRRFCSLKIGEIRLLASEWGSEAVIRVVLLSGGMASR